MRIEITKTVKNVLQSAFSLRRTSNHTNQGKIDGIVIRQAKNRSKAIAARKLKKSSGKS